MRNFLTDLRYSWRAARRSPGVTLAIIAMLALGTGGVTAVFNPVYSALIAPLPFPQPEQLMLIGGNIPMFNASFNRFEPEDELHRIFSNLATYAPFPAISVVIPETGDTKEYTVVDVGDNFFETLGIQPLRGSLFNRGQVGYIVSSRFWRNELMGAEDVIGKPLQTSITFGRSFPIVGVMPESFNYPFGVDIWAYRASLGGGATLSHARRYIGRLRPGMSAGQTAEELRAIEYNTGPWHIGSDGPLLQSLQTVIRGDRRPILLMFGSAAVLFLVLVCAGVMNLLITQGARRKSEIALRLILGASRLKLIFQLLRESLPLVFVGAFAGLWISEIASAWLTVQFPALQGGEVVVPVKMAFFAALVFAVTVIGGLTPALYATGVNLNTYLKSGSDAKRLLFPFYISLRELLVGVQFGLALALLIGVGLLISNMIFHVDVPIRWTSRDIAVVTAQFPTERQPVSSSPEAMTRNAMFFQEFQHNLSTIPEVVSAGLFNPIPFSANAKLHSQGLVGAFKYPPGGPERGSARVIAGRANSEGFEILELRLITGRHFSPADMAGEIAFNIGSREASRAKGRSFVNMAGGVVIVNQSLARQFWPGENAVGKVIYDGQSNSYEIIGVVQDFHQAIDDTEVMPVAYYPPNFWLPNQTFLVKLHSRALMKDFRQRISGFDTGSVTIEVQSFGDIVHEATANTRMTLQLLGIFALLGILVAGLGVYASTSLMAAAWTREMGIRKALGAQAWDILRLALWRGTRAILFGLPLGLFFAWILSRLLFSYMFHFKVNDPLVWIAGCALLTGITIVAALIPALRAARINPMDALRKE